MSLGHRLPEGRKKIILGDPFNYRNANRVAEAKKCFVQRRIDLVIVRHPLQPCALTRAKEADLAGASAALEKNLSPTAALGRSQAAGHTIDAQRISTATAASMWQTMQRWPINGCRPIVPQRTTGATAPTWPRRAIPTVRSIYRI